MNSLNRIEIAFHPTRYYPECVADFFDETFWMIYELKADVSAVCIHRSKVYRARGIFAAFALPGDELVWNLIGDSSIPLFIVACYLGFPVQSLIIVV